MGLSFKELMSLPEQDFGTELVERRLWRLAEKANAARTFAEEDLSPHQRHVLISFGNNLLNTLLARYTKSHPHFPVDPTLPPDETNAANQEFTQRTQWYNSFGNDE